MLCGTVRVWARTLRYNTDISLERHKQSYRWLQHGEDTRGIKAVITQKHAFRVSRKPLLSSKKNGCSQTVPGVMGSGISAVPGLSINQTSSAPRASQSAKKH